MYKKRLFFKKQGRARYNSHLDLMKLLARAFSRAKIPVKYSEGFNPHMILSILLPLSLGHESVCEMCDFVLLDDGIADERLVGMLNGALIEGVEAVAVCDPVMPVSAIAFCRYEIEYPALDEAALAALFERPIEIEKRSKRGSRQVILNDYVREIEFTRREALTRCACVLNAGEDPLNPEYITRAIAEYAEFDRNCAPLYRRTAVFDANMNYFK